jgi:glucose-1-phosphate cytidylyltransferase
MNDENKKMEPMDVVILCGGKGTRLSEETSLRPKPMIDIGGKPILWHIMKYYSSFGLTRFILALGYKAEYIKQYFYNYKITNSDFTINLQPDTPPTFYNTSDEKNWEITFIDTGLNTLKGGRIKRIAKYLKSDNFHLTYGDGVADVNLNELTKFHHDHNKIASVTAVRPPSRFGEMIIEGNDVSAFDEKSQMHSGYINGGFFILNRKVLTLLSEDEDCDFEFGPLQEIVRQKQLKAMKHNGFWQCMDNVRERDYLTKLIETNKAPWINW